MYVIKRDGNPERVSFDKITRRLQLLCQLEPALSPDVDPVLVTQKVVQGVYNGVHTSQLDHLAAETAAYMGSITPGYNVLAARIAISNLQKQTSDSLLEVADLLHSYVNAKTGLPSSLLADDIHEVITKHADVLQSAIKYERDFNYSYFGFKTLERSYLFRIDGDIVERPQHMLMRVAVGLHKDDIPAVLETYSLLSQQLFTHATPTLFNAGTPRPQLSSCFLLTMKEDSIEGIYDTLKQCALISKSAGGIGVAVHRIRASNSYIRGTNGTSNGLIPMLRVYNDTARYVDQGGGKRKGAFAIYLEPWHADIFEFLDLKKNHGKEENRARDLFYGLWVPDLFMYRVQSGGDWSLFCPNEAPGLFECWGEKFTELYERYESEGRARRTVKAQELWFAILESQIETGTPYILYKDSCNKKSNQKHLGTIQSSNLCTEVIQYTSPDEVAVCNLASLALPKFVSKGSFDHQKLHDVVKVVTRNLNKVIDINYYPVPEARNSNKRHRPIGIGVQGLADVFMLLRCPWESPEARELNRAIFETIYFAALTASNELAKEQGTYETYQGSPASQGKLQPDLWGVTPSNRWDWATVRANIAEHGLRNSLLVAPMPTASTSQILGNNECFVGETPVTLSDGTSVYIKDLPIEGGRTVVAYNEQFKGTVLSSQSRLIDQGERDVVRVTFQDGRTIVCTPDHKFLTSDGDWEEISTLSGERIKCSLTGPIDVPGEDEQNWQLELKHGVLKMNDPVNRRRALAFARIVGFVCADGGVQPGKVTAAFGNVKDAEAFMRDYIDIAELCGGRAQIVEAGKGCCEVQLTGKLACSIRELEGIVCGARVSQPHGWPSFVTDSDCPSAILREFMAGLFGGDCHMPCIVGDTDDRGIQTLSPMRISQTTCPEHVESLCYALNQLCDVLAKLGVPGARITATRRQSKANGENYRCGHKEHITMIVSLPGSAIGGHAFAERIGVRYSTSKAHRVEASASWYRYVSEIERQRDQLVNRAIEYEREHDHKGAFSEGLAIAINELKSVEPLLNEHYLAPNNSQLSSKYVTSARDYFQEIGVSAWFNNLDDNEVRFSQAVSCDAEANPTYNLKVVDIRPAGKQRVYDISVEGTHNFVANGAVVHNCFEAYTSNIYTRRILAGDFTVVNDHLLRDLMERGLWSPAFKNKLVAHNGSVQQMDEIPDELKKLYKTVWEIPQRVIIDMAADRSAYIDQSQSLNIYMGEPSFAKLTSMHFYAWSKGLKTGMYYLRTRPAANAIKFTVEQEAAVTTTATPKEEAEPTASPAKRSPLRSPAGQQTATLEGSLRKPGLRPVPTSPAPVTSEYDGEVCYPGCESCSG